MEFLRWLVEAEESLREANQRLEMPAPMAVGSGD
jgi:hypothetical protein